MSESQKGKKYSDESKKKMSNAQKGEKSHCYGKKWISNLKLGKSKYVMQEEIDYYLELGWVLGRKVKKINLNNEKNT